MEQTQDHSHAQDVVGQIDKLALRCYESLALCGLDDDSAGRTEGGRMMTRCRWFVTSTVLMCGLSGVGLVQLASQQAPRGGPPDHVVDRFQRTHEVLRNNELATSGVARGETIYFYKCWMCHNNGARKGDESGLVGPSLKNVTGRLKTDETLAKSGQVARACRRSVTRSPTPTWPT